MILLAAGLLPDMDDEYGAASTASAGDYDVVVIGSGFGGSVGGLRLTEKGYRVGGVDTRHRGA